jgi:N-acetylmuramoyl-L-alanine amidase
VKKNQGNSKRATGFNLAKGMAKWQNSRMAHYGKLLATLLLGAAAVFTGCQQQGRNSYLRTPKAVRFQPVRTPLVQRSISRLAREVNIKVRIMPSNSRQRRGSRRLNPSFITIHSTANHSPSSTAMQHSRALCRGAFTNRSWHFTVDQFMCVQNLPLRETGWHAGTAAGNHNSIGIEMCECENKGHNHFRTWDRAAKLTAVLMKRYGINLRRVVPHYHWTRKNCPAPLLTNGKPGPKWAWFHSRVDYYYRCINQGKSNR